MNRTIPGLGSRPDWHTVALCPTDPDPDAWFSTDTTKVRHAVNICLHCPARDDCRQDARARGELWGVWGGEVFHKVKGHAREYLRGRDLAIVIAYECGCSLREIAEVAGLSHAGVAKIIDREGVSTTQEDES